MSKATGNIVGRLARDPETRTTSGGTQLVTCTIPTDSGWGDNKATTWWRVTIFGKKSEIVAKHLRKGSWAMFTGEISVREYDKKDGTKGFSTEMVANDFAFVGNKSDNDSGGQSGGYSKPTPAPTQSQQGGGGAFADDDIPF